MFFRLCINRPVAVSMSFLALFVFGLISIFTMPVNLFPLIDVPIIKITAQVRGSLDYMENEVTKPIERASSELAGVKNIQSLVYENISITVLELHLGQDVKHAASQLREKLGRLAVVPSVEIMATDAGEVLSLFLPGSSLDFMREVDENLLPSLRSIKGVGGVKLLGWQKPAVFIKPKNLAKHNLSVFDIYKALEAQNINYTLGKLDKLYLSANFKAKNIEELGLLRVAPGLMLKEIADINLELDEARDLAYFNGEQGLLLRLSKASGFNLIKACENIKEAAKGIENAQVVFDKSEMVLKHIKEVRTNMLLGVLLTIFVVFLFLRNIKAAIIAAISLPCSIVSSFFIIDLLGFDLNRLSIIALTLSMGIFIDDAIVVIENMSRKSSGSLMQKAYEGVREVGFSLFAISAVLLCIFVPLSYMNSIPGRFFQVLGLCVSSGVVISLLVSLSLIPSLGARFFGQSFSGFNFFAPIELAYTRLLSLLLRYKLLFLSGVLALFLASLNLLPKIGLDFLPMEDDAQLLINIQAKKSEGLEHSQELGKGVLEELEALSEVDYAYLTSAYDDAKSPSKAQIYVKLKPLDERALRQSDFVAKLRASLKQDEMQVSVLEYPKLGELGFDKPLQMYLMGKAHELEPAINKAKALLSTMQGVVDISDTKDTPLPYLDLSLDRERASKLGLNPGLVAQALQLAYAKMPITSLANNDPVILKMQDFSSLNLNALTSVISSQNIDKQPSLLRLNHQRALRLGADITKEGSLKAAADFLEDNKEQYLSPGMEVKFTGFAEVLEETIFGFVFALSLGLVLVYFVLASMYESFLLPFVIMLTMPLGFAGAAFAIFITSHHFSMMVLIALMLLFGMVAKNAILLVDVANKLCREGKSGDEAILLAGSMRVRAITMTSIAMIAAMAPLALSQNSGYEANAPMAIALIGGLISSTALTLFALPCVFGIVYKLDSRLRRIYERQAL